MGCSVKSDCDEDSFCNQVFFDCQHCSVVCNPQRREFGECVQCPDYTESTHTAPTAPSTLIQLKPSDTLSSSDLQFPVLTITITLIAITSLLVVFLVIKLFQYSCSSELPLFSKKKQRDERQKKNLETLHKNEKYDTNHHLTIYPEDKKPPQGIYGTAVKMKDGEPQICIELENLQGHISNPLPIKQSVSHQGLVVPVSPEVKIPLGTSENANDSYHETPVCRPCTSLSSNSNNSAGSINDIQQITNTSQHAICGDSIIATTLPRITKRKSSVTMYQSEKISTHGQLEHPYHDTTQYSSQNTNHQGSSGEPYIDNVKDVIDVICLRDISNLKDVHREEQDTRVKELTSSPNTTLENRPFTLDATPDIKPIRCEPENTAQAKPHPNRVIYDILKGIDWVQGYYSEGQSIEVYADLKYISEEVAMKELTVRTGVGPQKFHLRQSEASSYY